MHTEGYPIESYALHSHLPLLVLQAGEVVKLVVHLASYHQFPLVSLRLRLVLSFNHEKLVGCGHQP